MSAVHGHPVECRDCGSHLVLVCPKGHDSVELSVAEQCGTDKVPHEPRSHRTYAAKPCRRCHAPFMPTGPRALDCATCRGLS